MSVPRWNMRAVISTVDIERSRTGMYVKYEDHAEAIAALKSQRDELLRAAKAAERLLVLAGLDDCGDIDYIRVAIARAEGKE